MVAAPAERDLLSGPEELLEKALTALMVRRPDLVRPLGAFHETTLEQARAHVEGRAAGAFPRNSWQGSRRPAAPSWRTNRSGNRASAANSQ
jgi:hypothetical protein